MQGVLSFLHLKKMMINRIETEIFILETKGASCNEDILQYWNALYNYCRNDVSL